MRVGLRSTGALGLVCGMLALVGGPACAEHFDMQLRVHGASGSISAGWDTDPPEGGVNPRPVLVLPVGEELQVEWSVRDSFPHGVMKQVHLHLFAAPEGAIGQKRVPTGPYVFESSLVADFLPDHAARGSLRFHIRKPGVYLIRIQSEGTALEHGHEHFSALDLRVAGETASRAGATFAGARFNANAASHPVGADQAPAGR
jgi:hypothetical protein